MVKESDSVHQALPHKRRSPRSRLKALMTCASMLSANCTFFHQTWSTHGHTQLFYTSISLVYIQTSVDCPCPIVMTLWRSKPHINPPDKPVHRRQHPLYLSPSHLSFTCLSHLPVLAHPPMNTRTKNKSKHPAAPTMTPGQLAAAGISKRQPKRYKKQTKDQCIAALEEDLRATQELLRTVCAFLVTLVTILRIDHNF